ncbi:MAG TPA: hypothetical protein VE650_02510 [Acetobacteraceae bacterium]|jgi:hypothetical protein|nr:hypothetical protein [Acetobacteraceae bacterium]
MLRNALFASLILLGAAAGATHAQAQDTTGRVAAGETPRRIGPIWDGLNHEPNPAEVEARRGARGLATDPRAEAARAAELDRLYRELAGEALAGRSLPRSGTGTKAC